MIWSQIFIKLTIKSHSTIKNVALKLEMFWKEQLEK